MELHTSIVKRLALGTVIVGLVVVIVMSLRGGDHPGATAPQAAPAAPAAAVAKSQPAAPSSPPGGYQAPKFELPPLMPEEVTAEILKKDKRLGLFMDYHQTVLLSEPRRDEYRKLLSDIDMMKAMAEGLSDPGSGRVVPEEYYRRLMQIDYFQAALDWKDNPQRDKVLEITASVIGKDNFAPDQDTARRQMLGGTKMELYRIMALEDPVKAQDMVAQAKGTRMEKMISWMAEEDARRTRREAEIEKEYQELQDQAN